MFGKRRKSGVSKNGVGRKKMMISRSGADIESGSLGSSPLFQGTGQKMTDTVCVNGNETVQKRHQYEKRIRLTDKNTGQFWESFFQKEIIIGRKKQNLGQRPFMCIPYSGISAVHCRIFLSGSGVYVEDKNSTNGTFVNGSKVTDIRALRSKDALRLGNKEFIVYIR